MRIIINNTIITIYARRVVREKINSNLETFPREHFQFGSDFPSVGSCDDSNTAYVLAKFPTSSLVFALTQNESEIVLLFITMTIFDNSFRQVEVVSLF